MAIDYERMKRVYPKQKAALTRAQKKGYGAVRDVCRAAVAEWDAIGAWPDGWSTWQRALDDAALTHNLYRAASGAAFVEFKRLEEL